MMIRTLTKLTDIDNVDKELAGSYATLSDRGVSGLAVFELK